MVIYHKTAKPKRATNAANILVIHLTCEAKHQRHIDAVISSGLHLELGPNGTVRVLELNALECWLTICRSQVQTFDILVEEFNIGGDDMTVKTVKRLERHNTIQKKALTTALKKDPMARILITVHTHAIVEGHLVAGVFREDDETRAYFLGEEVGGI